jgi:hypothetical protein
MRRIVPFAIAAVAVLACEPGNGGFIPTDGGHVRFANFIVDAPNANFERDGFTVALAVPFRGVSTRSVMLPDSAIFTVRRTSDAFLIATDTLPFIIDRRYTLFALGEVTDGRFRLAQDDTVLAGAGQIKVRFVHAVGTEPLTADFWITDTGTVLDGETPNYSGLAYGAASNYVAVDTQHRRFRVTRNGLTTPYFDTTFATAFPSGHVLTFVMTNSAGGGATVRLTSLTDTMP